MAQAAETGHEAVDLCVRPTAGGPVEYLHANEGRLEQVGTPEEIYDRPSSRWLAEFLGDADVLPGTANAGVVDCELGRALQ